jgi:exonuclease III
MRFMFWNIRGFGNPARRRQIREYIREEKLDAIGLQETIKEEFSNKDLNDIVGGLQFRWFWQSAKGHSGGILMGVREEFLEIEDHEIGEYFISLVVRHRTINFRWEIMIVYGHAQHDKSRDFIAELSRKCMTVTLPVVMGGDFNLIRQASEKNNDNINQGMVDMFNMFIDLHQL